MMTRQQALGFLRRHQPLPPDDELSDELMGEYDEVRRFFLTERDAECIPLFLGSFGDGSGFGVYQLIEDVLLPFDADQVVPHLAAALTSPSSGVRYWCAQIAASFPDDRLVPMLVQLLADPSSDTRATAVCSIARIGGADVRGRLEALLEVEKDEHVIEALREELSG